MSNPSFSIIIPHYNIPDLLMRCLKSIPVSEDIQVIVVDDNSPDADTYLERYPELSRPYLEFIRTTKGGGAGYARNVGLDHAIGKWLLFADSDDFYVENMYDVIKPYAYSEADIVFFRPRSVYSDDIYKKSNKGDYLIKDFNICKDTGDERYVRYRWCPPWSKMLKTDFIKNHCIRFDEIQYTNDYYFSVCSGIHAKKIEVAEEILYVYVDREDSLTANFCCKQGELAIRADVAFRVEKLFKQYGIHINQHSSFIWYLNKIFRNDKKLFFFYFKKLHEIYSLNILNILSFYKDRSAMFKLFLFFYAFLIWTKRLFSRK